MVRKVCTSALRKSGSSSHPFSAAFFNYIISALIWGTSAELDPESVKNTSNIFKQFKCMKRY